MTEPPDCYLEGPFRAEALRPAAAPAWQRWGARVFGQRITGIDGCYIVELALWRGRLYLLQARPASARPGEEDA